MCPLKKRNSRKKSNSCGMITTASSLKKRLLKKRMMKTGMTDAAQGVADATRTAYETLQAVADKADLAYDAAVANYKTAVTAQQVADATRNTLKGLYMEAVQNSHNALVDYNNAKDTLAELQANLDRLNGEKAALEHSTPAWPTW